MANDDKGRDAAKGGHDKGDQDKGGQDKGGQDKGAQDKGGQDKGGHDKGGPKAEGGQDTGGHDKGGPKAEGGDAGGPPKAEAAPTAPAKPVGSGKGKLLLVAWGQSPATAWVDDFKRAGYDVELETDSRITAFQTAKDEDLAAVIIDLSTKPQDGRKLADTLRISSATSDVRLFFTCADGSEASSELKTAQDVIGKL